MLGFAVNIVGRGVMSRVRVIMSGLKSSVQLREGEAVQEVTLSSDDA
jgi:hypothetical protein